MRSGRGMKDKDRGKGPWGGWGGLSVAQIATFPIMRHDIPHSPPGPPGPPGPPSTPHYPSAASPIVLRPAAACSGDKPQTTASWSVSMDLEPEGRGTRDEGRRNRTYTLDRSEP